MKNGKLFHSNPRVALLFLLAGAVLLLVGCTAKQFAIDSKEVAETTSAISKVVPLPIGLYLKLASCIITAISGVAFGVHRWGVSVKLKNAIRTRAGSIDAAKASDDTSIQEAARKTLKFVKEFEALHNPSARKHGGYFDAVRKFYK